MRLLPKSVGTTSAMTATPLNHPRKRSRGPLQPNCFVAELVRVQAAN
jgi:hypothetical protein